MRAHRKEIIGDATLYLGDCAELLDQISAVDALVTDPPYGIGEAARRNKTRSTALAYTRDWGVAHWDDQPISDELMGRIRAQTQWQIIFGGNYYALPPTSCWLVWDKENGANAFADCELAWTNLPRAVRRLRHRWNGVWQADMANRELRVHPTQKPVAVMEWCIGWLPKSASLIFDPFMGSGTTGVACANLGRKFIGIEIDEKYFDIACKRIALAMNQQRITVD